MNPRLPIFSFDLLLIVYKDLSGILPANYLQQSSSPLMEKPGGLGTGLDRLDPVTGMFTHFRHK